MSAKHILIALVILLVAGGAAFLILKPAGASPISAITSVISAKALVQLASEPGDAEIWIDGVRKGNTPVDKGMTFAINLTEGSHKLEMRLAKEPVRLVGFKEIVVAADTVQSLTLTLVENAEDRAAADALAAQRQNAEQEKQAARERLRVSDKRFIDNNDGTVSDLYLGVFWLKNQDALGQQEAETAKSICASLGSGQAGLSDNSSAGQWRLPFKQEFTSLCEPSFIKALSSPSVFKLTTDSGSYWVTAVQL